MLIYTMHFDSRRGSVTYLSSTFKYLPFIFSENRTPRENVSARRKHYLCMVHFTWWSKLITMIYSWHIPFINLTNNPLFDERLQTLFVRFLSRRKLWSNMQVHAKSQCVFNLCDTSSSSSILVTSGTNDSLDMANDELEKYLSNWFPLWCYKW